MSRPSFTQTTAAGATLRAVPDDHPTQARLQAERRTWQRRQVRQRLAEHRLRWQQERRLHDVETGHPSLDRARLIYQGLSTRIDQDVLAGARVHQRLPWWLRIIPAATAVLDGVVLFVFFAALFAVPLDDPVSLRGLVAASFAVLGSAVTYLCLALAGRTLRGRRTVMGEVDWRYLGPSVWFLLGLSLLVAGGLGVLMYARLVIEGSWSHFLAPSQVQLVAVVFALFSVGGNLATLVVHALDGSDEAALLRRVGARLRRRERRCYRAERACLRGQGRGSEEVVAQTPVGSVDVPVAAAQPRTDEDLDPVG